MKEEVTHSEKETMALGRKFARGLKPGDVVCLVGELGAGKTRFVKGMGTAFGIPEKEIRSPTFTLISEHSGELELYHFDCYRLESVREAEEIGAEEYFHGGGVSVIEWPEIIRDIIPPDAIWIRIERQGPTSRKFVIGEESP